MTCLEEFEHERGGTTYRVRIYHDPDMGAPWEEHDGHGIVSEWTTRKKASGERVLCQDRRSFRYYDIQESTKTAKRDGWDAAPYGGTSGEKAAKAVEADFQRLRGWCNDEWTWIGIEVAKACPACGSYEEGEYESLWGIESDCGDYRDEVIQELIEQLNPAIAA